jgi:SET domain
MNTDRIGSILFTAKIRFVAATAAADDGVHAMLLMTQDHEEEDDGEKGDEDFEDSEKEEGFHLLMGGRLRWEDLASAPLSAWDDKNSVDDTDDRLHDSNNRNHYADATTSVSNYKGAVDLRYSSLDSSSVATAPEREPTGSSRARPSGCRHAVDECDDNGRVPAIRTDDHDDDRDSFMYSLAHGFELSDSSWRDRSRTTTTTATTVRVADVPHKGRGLVAATSLPRGKILYTERAVVACQVISPSSNSSSTQCTNNGIIGDGNAGHWASGSEDGDDDLDDLDGPNEVRACQQCFRSLEPCLNGLPHPELWPAVVGANSSSSNSSSGNGREWPAQCSDACGSWLCSMRCFQQHMGEYGSCCDLRNAAKLLRLGNGDGADLSAEPAIALAISMLRHCLQYHRQGQTVAATSEKTNDGVSQSAVDGTMLRGLCGDPADVTPLELGFPDATSDSSHTSSVLDPSHVNCTARGLDNDGTTSTQQSQQSPSPSPPIPNMTLEPLYKQLVEVWSMSPDEASFLNLHLFHRLAAMAARNGVGMSPVSPFATYYQALIRRAGGRGTTRHARVVEQVALAVSKGATNRLERGMDRHIQEKVSPRLVAIFALTSRINHDCQPNAELVTSFADCHVDVRLLRDVIAGDEITINYVGRFGNRNKSLECRQKELRRKYLFNCRCRLCLVGRGE